MAKERETYRDELEGLRQAFPDKRILSKTDVYRYLGRGRDWCSRHLDLGETGTSVYSLARQLSALE